MGKITLTSLNYYEVMPFKRTLHQLDPMAWYRERWLGDPLDFKWSSRPEYSGHKWDGTPDPLFHAWDGLACGLDVGVESATSMGKTFMASIIAYWFLDVFPESTVVLIGPSFRQLQLTLGAEIRNKFHKLRLLHPNAIYLDSVQITMDGDDLEKSKWKLFAKAVKISADEKQNVSAAGVHAEHMLYILDEGAGIPTSVYSSVINTSTAENNLILAMGNPNSQSDPLHVFCKRHGVRHVQMSAYDHPNVVLNRVIVPGAVTADSIRMRAGKHGENVESPEYKSRVRGLSPKEAANSLFKRAWFDAAEALGRDPNFVPDPLGENALGVDVANSMKGDKGACIYSEKNLVTKIIEFVCPDATHLAYNLIHGGEWCEEQGWNNYGVPSMSEAEVWDEQVAIDGNGVGAGTVSTMANEGYRVYNVIGGQDLDAILADHEGKPLHRFENLRAQVIWTLAEELRKGEIAISPFVDREMFVALRSECLVVERVKEGGGSIKVESKDQIKKKLANKSPNLLDAFA